MAVYTKLTHTDIENILQNYDIGQLIEYQEIITGVENSNFLLKTDQTQAILTIFEQRTKNEDLPFFFNLMNHLAKKSFPCPQIYNYKNNNLNFNFYLKSGVMKKGAIASFLIGKALDGNIAPIHCQKLGQKLANLHITTQDFTEKRNNHFDLIGIETLYQALNKENLIPDEIIQIINKIFIKLKNNNFSNLEKGIIHGDLFPDNVFFIGNNITGIIDFYFAAYDYYIFDLAICINAWCFDQNKEFYPKLFTELFTGYNSIRPINNLELLAIKDFCLLAAIRFYLTRLYDQNKIIDTHHIVEAKDPNEYLNKILFFNSLSANKFANLI